MDTSPRLLKSLTSSFFLYWYFTVVVCVPTWPIPKPSKRTSPSGSDVHWLVSDDVSPPMMSLPLHPFPWGPFLPWLSPSNIHIQRYTTVTMSGRLVPQRPVSRDFVSSPDSQKIRTPNGIHTNIYNLSQNPHTFRPSEFYRFWDE